MKKLFYIFMMQICWLLEDICDNIFGTKAYKFYPSRKWEILYEEEDEK